MESPHLVSILRGDSGFERFLGLNGPPIEDTVSQGGFEEQNSIAENTSGQL